MGVNAVMIKPSRLGHVVLRVRDLKRSEEFYTQFLGLGVRDRAGDSMVFFTSDPDIHHDLAVAKIADDAPGPEPTRVGLYHIAYELGSIDDIKEAYRLAKEMGVRIAGYGDHGDTKRLYVLDPDGIEIELYAFAPQYRDAPLEEILSQSLEQPAPGQLALGQLAEA